MFEKFHSHLQGFSAWMESCYSCQLLLNMGNHTTESCCRIQQGDPLGLLSFAMTLHQDEVPSINLNTWYLDDGTLMGSPESLTATLRIVEEMCPFLGLTLNQAKSLLHIPSMYDSSSCPLPADIPITHESFSLMGCPIGQSSFCKQVLQRRIAKSKRARPTLSKWRILRQNWPFFIPAYSLRTVCLILSPMQPTISMPFYGSPWRPFLAVLCLSGAGSKPLSLVVVEG